MNASRARVDAQNDANAQSDVDAQRDAAESEPAPDKPAGSTASPDRETGARDAGVDAQREQQPTTSEPGDAAARPSPTPADAGPDASSSDRGAGPSEGDVSFAVGSTRVELAASDGRVLPVQVWYPATEAARAEASAGHAVSEFEPHRAQGWRDRPRAFTTGSMEAAPPRVFLLSPARCSGTRASALVHGPFGLGQALRSDQGAPLGEVFAFVSSLYFRGKLAYAARFAATALPVPSALVITPGHGLCRPSTRIRASDLAAIAAVEVDADNPQFAAPLQRDATLLAASAPPECELVLLGSIATRKYVEPLLAVFGERLLFPREFVGRGDMSRGGLLLRAAREGRELAYAPVQSSERRGPRARRIAQLKSE